MMLVQEASDCPGKDVGFYIEGFKWGEDMKRLTLPSRKGVDTEGGREEETREEVTELVGLAQHGVYFNLMFPSFLFFGALLHRAVL